MTEPIILSIIPARGGSERVPRKNLMAFAGKPLLAWTIEASLGAARVGRTVVSTDDAEIKQVALSYGAEVIDRPADLSQARSTSESALVHALDHLRESEGYIPDIVVFPQATSPLRGGRDIDAAIDKLIAEDADSLLTVSPVPGPGFLWHVKPGEPAKPFNFDPQNRPRTQDFVEEYFAENGSFYVFRREVLERYNCRLGGRITVYRQPLEHGFEIDKPRDLRMMQELAKAAID
jgi:CMP-N,N'-diacetyllegionaminic acid synthase